MSEQSGTGQTPTSAALFQELQHEERAFRGLMGLLVVLLLLAAAIGAGGAAFSYFELQKLRTEHATQLALSRANVKVIAGEAARQRETNNARFVALREELDAANAHLDLRRVVEQAEDLAPYRDEAIGFARLHVLGEPLNSSTADIVTVVFNALDEEGQPVISGPARELVAAVKADWLRDVANARAGFTALYQSREPAEWRALGAAGLSRDAFLEADAGDLGWDEGCGEAVRLADEAIGLGLNEPRLLAWQGECRRKNGETQLAYEAFRTAHELLVAARAGGAEVDQEVLREAVHGEGTTLIALTAHEEAVDGLPPEPLARAEALLEQAADLRRQRQATDVGVAYTTENKGFLYVLRGDWEGALRHTNDIDAILPLAWNLTVRHIAATEQAGALAALGADGGAGAAELAALAEEAELVLSLMPIDQFDVPELLRLLPPRYAATVRRLAAPAETRAQDGAPATDLAQSDL